ncbi:MAG: DUF6515 family protein [Luteolibacter sp.]
MKPSTTPLLLATGLVFATTLTSCVVPADMSGATTTTTTYTDYQPGYRTTSLPDGYRSEEISGSTYYYNDGHYYRSNSGGYVVVAAPRTSRFYSDYDSRRRTTTAYQNPRTGEVHVITTLPPGYREINHRGTAYYQSGDRYYRRQGNGYITVSSPY